MKELTTSANEAKRVSTATECTKNSQKSSQHVGMHRDMNHTRNWSQSQGIVLRVQTRIKKTYLLLKTSLEALKMLMTEMSDAKTHAQALKTWQR